MSLTYDNPNPYDNPYTYEGLLPGDSTGGRIKGWAFVLVQADAPGTQLGELSAAKAKQVTWPLNDVASASFTIDGTHPQAALIAETATDLIIYDPAGKKRFRGRMGSSSDAIAANGHVVTFSAVDYRGLLARRLLRDSATMSFTSEDQGQIAAKLIYDSEHQTGATPLITPGTGLTTGVTRTIAFTALSKIADLINGQLASVTGGFDWEIDGDLNFNVYYPERGSTTAVVLEYGSSVLGVPTRSIDTSNFANVVVETGDTTTTPVKVTAGSFGAAGTWETSVGDTSIQDQPTLTLRAGFQLAASEVLTPSYSLVLRPGWWTPAQLWLGDTALVVVKSGRVNDIGLQRISQVQVAIGDDGGDVVTLTTGPVALDQAAQLAQALNRIGKLETL